jgi:hypothetical protein
MSDETLAKLKGWMGDADYKTLLEFCLEPKTWKEIAKIKIKDSKKFEILKNLKTCEAIQFADGKYYSAAFIRDLLK